MHSLFQNAKRISKNEVSTCDLGSNNERFFSGMCQKRNNTKAAQKLKRINGMSLWKL